MGEDIVRYADAAMYDAQPIQREEGVRVTPRVFLLNATPDPLGSLAADMRMYRGDPVYSLNEVTDDERRWAWKEVMKTALNTPLEGITVKFMLEAVTRSFTHQAVRQRVGAYYIQESLRFAVKRGLAKEVALPPSIADQKDPEGAAKIWAETIARVDWAYKALVDAGIPAEDARGLLPHAVTTRMIYHVNLRALFDMVAMRLCTQAQFEWRLVVMGMMKAMREYGAGPPLIKLPPGEHSEEELETLRKRLAEFSVYGSANVVIPPNTTFEFIGSPDAWQWQLIAEPAVRSFTPICYRQGKCALMSELDRGCTIRPRVEQFAAAGIPGEEWGRDHHLPYKSGEVEGGQLLYGIAPEEWLLDPTAGITTEDNRPS